MQGIRDTGRGWETGEVDTGEVHAKTATKSKTHGQ